MHTLERPKKYVCTALKHSSKLKYQKWNYTLTHNLVFLFALSFSLLSLCLSLSLSLSSLPFFLCCSILHSSFVCLLCFIAAFHEHMFFVSSILMPAFRCAIVYCSFRLLCRFMCALFHFCYYKYFISIQIAFLYAYGVLMNISSSMRERSGIRLTLTHALFFLELISLSHLLIWLLCFAPSMCSVVCCL